MASPNFLQAFAPYAQAFQPQGDPMMDALAYAQENYAPQQPRNVFQTVGKAASAGGMKSGGSRRSLLDIIGGIADTVATVGGSPALYQSNLDARDARAQAVDIDAMRRRQMEQQIEVGDIGIANDERERIGQVLGALGDTDDPAAAWAQIAPQAGIDPARAAAIGQALQQNPDIAGQLAVSMGYEPQRQGSMPSAVQNYMLYEQILREQGPEAAEQFRTFAQPSMNLTPAQAANIELGEDRNEIARDAADLARDRYENPPLSASERKTANTLIQSMPKLAASFRSATNDIDVQIRAARALREHPGLAGITGAIQGRIPWSITGDSNAAQAMLDTMLARGTFGELQEMRNNSPTGGALGSVSDAEGRRLQAAVGRLVQAQTKEDFQQALDDYVAELQFSKNNLTTAFTDSQELITRAAQPARSAPARSNAPRQVNQTRAAQRREAERVARERGLIR